MKKMIKNIGLALSLGLFSLTGFSQTQVGNSDFELWGNIGSDNERPTNWNNMMNGDLCTLCGFGKKQTVWRSSDVRPGSTGTYSAQVKTAKASGNIVNGNMTLGKLTAPSSAVSDPTTGYNISVITDANFSEAFTGKPDSVVFWAKYSITNNQDSARIAVTIHDNYAYRDPEDANSAPHAIAKAVKNFQTGNAWVRISIPFNYINNSLTPSFILVSLVSSYKAGAGVENASLLVDDLEFIYVPKFTQVPAICTGGSFTLPTTSTNGITGTWSPAIDNTQTTTYTFTPDAGQGASVTTMTVTVTSNPTPVFTQVPAICEGGSFTLPTTSNNSIVGTWSPAVNSTATTTYTFTPNAGQCGTTTTMEVVVNSKATPTFTQINPIASGQSFTLPTTSDNGITGTWSPAVNNTATTTYTFTPTAGQCANTTTMTVEVTVGLNENTMTDVKVFGFDKVVTVDLTNVDVENATISILDMAGKKIATSALTSKSVNTINLPSTTANGVYMYQIEGKGVIKTGKLAF